MSVLPPTSLSPELLYSFGHLPTSARVAAMRMRSGRVFNNEVEFNAAEQSGAETWTRTKTNAVSPESERPAHRNRVPGRGLEFVNVLHRG